MDTLLKDLPVPLTLMALAAISVVLPTRPATPLLRIPLSPTVTMVSRYSLVSL